MLFHAIQMCIQKPLIFSPVGEDISHGATGLIEAQVEAIGVNLRRVCDLEH